MLQLRNVSKEFESGALRRMVLAHLDLEIPSGELLAITGKSGSGKSTLLNILGCLDQATAGEYFIDGQLVSRLSPKALAQLRNQYFGFIFQFFGLISEYSAVENVMLPLLYRGLAFVEARKQARAMLDAVEMKAFENSFPATLSGGQQQRVAIARAMVGHPRVLLADEPTGSLDSNTGNDVMNLLREHNRQGLTVVVVTHSPEVSAYCSRVLYMADGALVTRANLRQMNEMPAPHPTG